MINSNSKETELGSVFDDQTMKANDKVITTIYCLIFIIGLVCNVSGIGLNQNVRTPDWTRLGQRLGHLFQSIHFGHRSYQFYTRNFVQEKIDNGGLSY